MERLVPKLLESARALDHTSDVTQANLLIQEFLKMELVRRVRANPLYSQAAFARDLGLSAGELSETLRGKRKITLRVAHKIVQKLGLNGFERDRFINWVEGREPAKPASATHLELFEMLADPTALAIFSLAELDGFKWSPAWIAKRLGLSFSEVEMALRKLERVKLLKKSPRGYAFALDILVSPDDVPSTAIRALHHHFLSRAKIALDVQALDQRQFNGLSFAIAMQDLSAIKKEISSFADHLEEKYSKKSKQKKNALYHFQAALFRLDEQGVKS